MSQFDLIGHYMAKEYFHVSFIDVKLRNKGTVVGKKKKKKQKPEIYVPKYLTLYGLFSLLYQSAF